MDYPEIRFNYKCVSVFPEVEVIANGDGSGLLIINKATDEEIDSSYLDTLDLQNIKSQVADWALHYGVMAQDSHPAQDHFGKSYVDGLNRDMNK